ncbi:MAG TPA: hypothetical protein PLG59_08740 [bacterium]|nr:hypothetical protein [bacterium]HQO34733.1 hypothetical protein [bacterium]HQP97848.1 hypothetical protein [bacterium]
MVSTSGVPNDVGEILLTGQAQLIHGTIQQEANIATQMLHSPETQKLADATTIRDYLERVKGQLDRASVLRNSLQSADHKIHLGRQHDPLLKQYSAELDDRHCAHTLHALIEFLMRLKSEPDVLRRNKSLPLVQRDVSESLQCRIEMAWNWDDILEVRRIFLVKYAMKMADQLTQIAVQIKDNKAIEKVRALLKKLHVTIPTHEDLPDLDLPMEDLMEILLRGIASLEASYEGIHRLDAHREEIRNTVNTLKEMSKRNDSPGASEQGVSKDRPNLVQSNRNGSRMVIAKDLGKKA